MYRAKYPDHYPQGQGHMLRNPHLCLLCNILTIGFLIYLAVIITTMTGCASRKSGLLHSWSRSLAGLVLVLNKTIFWEDFKAAWYK